VGRQVHVLDTHVVLDVREHVRELSQVAPDGRVRHCALSQQRLKPRRHELLAPRERRDLVAIGDLQSKRQSSAVSGRWSTRNTAQGRTLECRNSHWPASSPPLGRRLMRKRHEAESSGLSASPGQDTTETEMTSFLDSFFLALSGYLVTWKHSRQYQ